MRYITWYRLLAAGVAGVLLPSIAGWAQAPKTPAPQATVRELAAIEGNVWEWVLLPSRGALIYTSDTSSSPLDNADNSTFIYDVATKRRTLLGSNMLQHSVSPQGDRLAFSRSSEDGSGNLVWTMPIDPKTGAATGSAQRVSLRPTRRRPVFSPDGTMLAFTAGPRPDGTWDLALVPATGGPERVVANYPTRMGPHAWSADGKSLYVVRPSLNSPTVIERVPVVGGRSEPLIPWTQLTDAQPVGLSPDARVAFFHENPDRFFYRTASGVEGEISVALPPPIDEGDVLNMRLDSMRFTAMTLVQNQSVRVLDIGTGQVRELLPGNVQTGSPAWSPDGRRLAVLTGNRSHYDITVVNADGSSPRRHSVPVHLDGWFGTSPERLVWEQPWSPDGRFLAFRANRAADGQKVGYSPYDQYELAILDVNSGQTRVLTTSSSQIGRFVWRSDGNAIRAIKRTFVAIGSPNRLSIVEIPLTGPERLLRDVSAEFPKANDVLFTSGREAVVSVATEQSPERFLVALDGGATRRLPDPDSEPGSRTRELLVAGDQPLLIQVDAKGEARVIKILSTAGDSTRTLRLPFAESYSVAFPDGKQIVSIGKVAGDSVSKLFLVPLDGSATRLIGEITPGTAGRLLAPSPDGKLLAYTFDGPDTSKIFEIDLGPALQAIMKR